MTTHTRRSATTTAIVAATTGLFAIAAPAASASASSTSSAASSAVFSIAVVDPGAPVISSVVPHPASLAVAWTAPASGTPLSYAVLATSGSVVKATQVVPGDALETTLSGLANDVTYEVTVVPVSLTGLGVSSAAVAGMPLAASPVAAISEAVGNLAASKGLGFATLTWTAPASDGGASVQAYSVLAVDRANAAVAAWRNVKPDVRSASLSGLTGGHTYDLYVLPVNAVGFGKIAPAVSVTISGNSIVTPKTPTMSWSTAIPSGNHAVVSWGPAAENGEAVTGYNVVVIQHQDMTSWTVASADQRQVQVPLDQNGTAQVYVFAQSKSGFGTIGAPIPVVPVIG